MPYVNPGHDYLKSLEFGAVTRDNLYGALVAVDKSNRGERVMGDPLYATLDGMRHALCWGLEMRKEVVNDEFFGQGQMAATEKTTGYLRRDLRTRVSGIVVPGDENPEQSYLEGPDGRDHAAFHEYVEAVGRFLESCERMLASERGRQERHFQ
jgi:hypothetical protein